ncbi:hypothetical protein ACIHCQ_01145 [Streptomyces sp. NPDC052236]|uniref:hypothetical protein n=1 Tax=Streptomyces sp. NPDC052236 TaxID=3365686 RepID=UPI0037D5F1C8
MAARRIARYQHYASQTRASWESGGLVWRTVDADQDELLVIAAALSAFRSLVGVPSTPPS